MSTALTTLCFEGSGVIGSTLPIFTLFFQQQCYACREQTQSKAFFIPDWRVFYVTQTNRMDLHKGGIGRLIKMLLYFYQHLGYHYQ